jgi:HEPN domain-containing protein
MKPLTKGYVDKAEGDYVTANREFRERRSPNFDSACFHSQQCAEKYLKARLYQSRVAFSKTTGLEHLLTMCLSIEPKWRVLSLASTVLKQFSIHIGYPGHKADKAQAKDAVACCRVIRSFTRQSLGLKV